MRAKNSKEVTRGYLLFACGLFTSIIVGIVCVLCFINTASRDVAAIEERSVEYDAVFTRQIMLTEKVDSLYNGLIMLNADERINQALVQNRISTHKMELINMLDQMNSVDAILYRKLVNRINPMLQVKDSIRLLTNFEQSLKNDLRRCIQDNREATKRNLFQ